MRDEHLELAKALRNMTCLRSLTLLSNNGSSNVLVDFNSSLDIFLERISFKIYTKPTRSRRAHLLTRLCLPESLDLEPTRLPILTRITSPCIWIPQAMSPRLDSGLEIRSISAFMRFPPSQSKTRNYLLPISGFRTSPTIDFPLTRAFEDKHPS
jgi:hypothetical protein